jgi:hypothetical protein
VRVRPDNALWTVWNAASAAINAGLYAEQGEWYSLAAAVFCGLLFFVSAQMWIREDA